MNHRILVFYGSYRADRMGIRLAQFVVEGFRTRGDDVALIDAKAVGLPMLERMYKEYPRGAAPRRSIEIAIRPIVGASYFTFFACRGRRRPRTESNICQVLRLRLTGSGAASMPAAAGPNPSRRGR